MLNGGAGGLISSQLEGSNHWLWIFGWIPLWLLAIVELTPTTWKKDGDAVKIVNGWVGKKGSLKIHLGPNQWNRGWLMWWVGLHLDHLTILLSSWWVPSLRGMSLHFDLAVVALCCAGTSVTWPGCWWMIVEAPLESTFYWGNDPIWRLHIFQMGWWKTTSYIAHMCWWQDDTGLGTSHKTDKTLQHFERQMCCNLSPPNHLSLPPYATTLRASKRQKSDWEDSKLLGLGF